MNRFLFFYFIIIFFSSCNNDDHISQEDLFLKDALTSVTNKQIEGKWSIFKAVFNNKTTYISNPPKCPRDFFEFKSQKEYKEYLFKNSDCTPEINNLNYSLSKGVLSLSNQSQTDQWVITEITSNRFVFKFKFDLDSDGNLETIKAICNRYEPPMEIDTYTESFYHNRTAPHDDKISFKWDKYKGYSDFDKYEIYRLSPDCNSSSMELISTITDVDETFFIDKNPPAQEEICYTFKIYTSKGLLGESKPLTVSTDYLKVPLVQLLEPTLNGTTVELNWEKYKGNYFSHYEIEVKNYSSGSGYGYQEAKITVIDDLNTTNYSFDLPYISNPVFVIHSYNIFGSSQSMVIKNINERDTNFIRKEILPTNSIKYFDFSPNETIFFYTDFKQFYRYNYESYTVEKSITLNNNSIIFIKVIESSFGVEVIVKTSTHIKVYDKDLNFKYDMKIPYINLENISINENGYWIAADRSNLYSFSRTENKLNLINTNTLYNDSFTYSRINIVNLGKNRILATNYGKPQGLIIEIDSNGKLSTSSTPVDLKISSQWYSNYLFSNDKQYLLDIESNSLYSTKTYKKTNTLNSDFSPLGISKDGSRIFGTNNNSPEKKIKALNYPSLNEQIYESKGYSNVMFQNHLGQLISISKGLPGDLNGSFGNNDLFIEVIK